MKQNKYIRFLLFLVVNFLALAIGILLMKDGPRTEWYLSLNKAPWTPAGWVFGASWSTIMLLFAFYMTKLSFKFPFLDKKITILFSVQWFLNVGWNYFFFNQHLTVIGLVIITLLWLLIGYFTFKNLKELKGITLFILPYLIWMTIATSLNAYIVFYN
ncbi:tryptophan-rich sensory protein [Tenacibaculum finnmarkense genomovar finnmarkense]|uniref:TspO/MBR family protein n=1 Tax=Tenacibaculum TaxID=104267 RepID=UPI000C79887C|nr:TspO/MBR family protein [Tenacibaculum finnmarkense]SOU87422.1 TspO protein [Tenacibaculum dicentrarchi]MCD8416509.1 tryptophan-rich sensory protein [Tenacibaculum finnmarkense genomovar finnmarkense]MCG8185290.1 tryptophan-rich sensory protein [Tenacibaculum finnmarkense genomovar finnmarkense]MCG8209208.1 tryptophan-rich sensory protein [Tenacibaculum finnmarkense genomovar finnmarkense]MCG8212003.1 tryptophan-rich sensory protein [Tenacibaculum finnmarkense genomovar finnmarkense]